MHFKRFLFPVVKNQKSVKGGHLKEVRTVLGSETFNCTSLQYFSTGRLLL